VRPCDDQQPQSQFGVLCLDVDQDGRIDRGYTVARMISYRPEAPESSSAKRRVALGAVVGAGTLVVALLAVL
jgi:hypothetical protein